MMWDFERSEAWRFSWIPHLCSKKQKKLETRRKNLKRENFHSQFFFLLRLVTLLFLTVALGTLGTFASCGALFSSICFLWSLPELLCLSCKGFLCKQKYLGFWFPDLECTLCYVCFYGDGDPYCYCRHSSYDLYNFFQASVHDLYEMVCKLKVIEQEKVCYVI